MPDILALAESWRPDLIVHDSAECGAIIAAELLGIRHATVEVHPTAMSAFRSMLDEPLQIVRATFDRPPRPIRGLLDEYLTLIQFPPS